MSLTSEVVNNPAINNLVQSSLESESLRLQWFPCSDIANIKPTQIGNVHYATHKHTLYDGRVYKTMIMLLLVGNDETCTPTLMSEFARIYSLPPHKYNNDNN